MNMKPLSTNKGFTLIEVVIALAVLGFGILSMFSMQLFAIKGNTSANRITQGTTWGAHGLEQIMSYEYSEVIGTSPNGNNPLDNGPPVEVDVDDWPHIKAIMANIVDEEDRFDVKWTVTAGAPLDDMTTISVNIASKLDGKQVTLGYVKADPAF
jgi:prepilin-type N-terminal cleavage/methylation domain-containing protein